MGFTHKATSTPIQITPSPAPVGKFRETTISEPPRGRMVQPTNLEDILAPREASLLRVLAMDNFCDVETLARLNRIGIKTLAFLLYCLRKKVLAHARDFRANFGNVVEVTTTRPHLFSVNHVVARVFGLTLSRTRPQFSVAIPETDIVVIRALSLRGQLRASEVAELARVRPCNVSKYVDRLNARCVEFGWPDAILEEPVSATFRRYTLNSDFASIHSLKIAERQNLSVYFTRRQRQIIRWLVNNPFSSSNEVSDALDLLRKQNVWRGICFIRKKCLELEKQFAEQRHGHPFFMEVSGTHLYGFSKGFCQLFGLKYVTPDPMKVLRAAQQRDVYIRLQTYPKERTTDGASALGMDISDFINCRTVVRRKLVESGLARKSEFVPSELRTALIEIRHRTGAWDKRSLHERAERRKRLATQLARYRTAKDAVAAVCGSLTDQERQKILESDLAAARKVGEDKFGYRWPDVDRACRYALLTRGARRENLLAILETRGIDIERCIELINRCGEN